MRASCGRRRWRRRRRRLSESLLAMWRSFFRSHSLAGSHFYLSPLTPIERSCIFDDHSCRRCSYWSKRQTRVALRVPICVSQINTNDDQQRPTTTTHIKSIIHVPSEAVVWSDARRATRLNCNADETCRARPLLHLAASVNLHTKREKWPQKVHSAS